MFTLLVPGIESGWPPAAPRLPALERLLARGRSSPLDDDPWSALARLGGAEPGQWPIGPVSATAELPANSHACLRVEPLGARAEEQGMLRLPAGALGITMDEARALAAAFGELFAADGLRLEAVTPERWYLLIDPPRWSSLQWRGFEGPARSLAEQARPAPPEPALRLLLSEVEMLFHAHSVNEARRAQGAATIAGLHPWGGGLVTGGDTEAELEADTDARSSSPAPSSVARDASLSSAPSPGEPYLAGLGRLGISGAAQEPRYTYETAPGGFAWPVAAESIGTGPWEAVEADWAAPLLAALLRGGVSGIRLVTGRAIHETSRFAALRFWRRPRPVHQLC